MPRSPRNADADGLKPLLSFERVIYEKESFKLSQAVIAQIKSYAQYVKATTSHEPTQDEIVERGMQRLFEADKGFRAWSQQQANQPSLSAPAIENAPALSHVAAQ